MTLGCVKSLTGGGGSGRLEAWKETMGVFDHSISHNCVEVKNRVVFHVPAEI